MSLLRSSFAYTVIPCFIRYITLVADISNSWRFQNRETFLNRVCCLLCTIQRNDAHLLHLTPITFNVLKISVFRFCSSVVKITLLSTLYMETGVFSLTTNCNSFLLLLEFLKCFGCFHDFQLLLCH